MDRRAPCDAILCKLGSRRVVDAEHVQRFAEAAPIGHELPTGRPTTIASYAEGVGPTGHRSVCVLIFFKPWLYLPLARGVCFFEKTGCVARGVFF